MLQNAVTLENISKRFTDEPGKPLHVLENINLEVREGEFFVILGPSGSGKSTLLRIASGLDQSYEGRVRFESSTEERKTSFVFQQFALLPWLTVYENVGMGLTGARLSPPEKRARIGQELEMLHLAKFAARYPRELSGGMKQRVGLARALAADPKIIFMDEPFSELDSFTADELRKELLEIWEKRKPTIVMISHNIEEALQLADRIAVLSKIPARIERIIENGLPRPRERRSAAFYEKEDFLASLIKP